MKIFQLLLLLLFLPFLLPAQRSLTGLWTGNLSNDSVTVRQDQAFELALTQYKEKVYGYTRRTFIVNDTLYYVLKRVKGTIDGNVCEVKDDEYISYNFPGKLDKGVKVTYTFRLNEKDSSWSLDGDWNTNRVKKNFYAMGGKVSLQEEKNLDNSKIFAHLEELKLDKEVPFYTAYKQPAPAPEKTIAVAEPKKSAAKKKDEAMAKEATKKPVDTNNTETAKKDPPAGATAVVTIPEEKDPPATATRKPEGPEKKSGETITTPPPVENKTTPAPTAVLVKKPAAAAFVEERKTVPPQVVRFVSDSLELNLYDNGEVDGDTVSVLLDGEIILAKQGLKASSIKKMIYIDPAKDELTLLLYAENLGKYPPNTGLLVVHDGEEVYQVRFSADLQQNAAIIFRRKGK